MLRFYRLYLQLVSSFTPTLCASLLEARDGRRKFCRWTKKPVHIVLNIKVAISATTLAFMSLQQSSYWFAHTDVPSLSPLCHAQSPGGTHHRLFIWRLPAGHGRRPAETASRHLSAGVCQARQETGVSHSNLPMQCSHQRQPSKGQKGETGAKYSPRAAGIRIQFLAVVPSAWLAFQQTQLVMCTGGKAVWDCVLVAVLLTPIGWSGACAGGDLEGVSVISTQGLVLWWKLLWQVKGSNWQHHAYWWRLMITYSLPSPIVGSNKDHWQCRLEKRESGKNRGG